jgi:glycosyltransferase involved in cell wall biosynthesis
MKIRIMYVVSTLQRVGPNNQLYYLIKCLDKDIFDPIIVTLSPERPDSSYKRFKERGIRIESLGLSRLKGIFLMEKRLNNIINRWKPNIIQTLGFRADRVKIKFNIPKIISLRTSIKQAKPFSIKPTYLGQLLAILFFRFHLTYIFKKQKLIVSCSKSLYEDYDRLHNIKIRYIQNGVDTERYTAVSEEIKNKIRVKLDLSVDKKIYISAGSLIPHKNTGAIIKLFKRWDFLNDSLLIILGEGGEYNNYKKSVNNCDNIRLLGDNCNIKDIRRYLHASDYFISASKGEGLPNTVLEAMSTGTPCILSDIPPHREILSNNKLGVIFDNNDSNDLERKIKRINNMDYNNLSKNCRDHIIKYFSAERMSLDYQQLYSEILNFSLH